MSKPSLQFTYAERETLRMAATGLRGQGRELMRRHKDNPELRDLAQGLSNLATAIENHALIGGHMGIWASWTPRLPDFETDDSDYADD